MSLIVQNMCMCSSVCVRVYIYMYVCMCVYIYIYMYIYGRCYSIVCYVILYSVMLGYSMLHHT